jgi:Tol biopolymer transport system component
VASPASDLALGWLPDSRGLLFWSDRGGVPSLWVIRVENGQARGAPQLVRPDVSRPFALGFAGDDFYYGVASTDRQVYQAALDVDAGAVIDPPEPAAHGSRGSTTAPSWSPDGGRMVHVVERLQFGFSSNTLAVRDVATGAVRDYPLGLLNPRSIRWLPDGGGVVLMGGTNIYRLDFATGRLDSLGIGGSTFKGQLDLSPDGGSVFFSRVGRDGVELVRHDLDTGRETVLFSNAAAGNIIISQALAVSPDGGRIAYAVPDRERGETDLHVLPATGGASRVVHRVPREHLGQSVRSLAWSADGAHLIFVSDDALWRVRLADGDVRELLRMRGLGHLRLHPDGRRIAFAGGERRAEIWRLENPAAALDR